MERNIQAGDHFVYWLMCTLLIMFITLILVQGAVPIYGIENVGILIGDIFAPTAAVAVFAFAFYQFRNGRKEWEYSQRLQLETSLFEYKMECMALLGEHRAKVANPEDAWDEHQWGAISEKYSEVLTFDQFEKRSLEELRQLVREEMEHLALVKFVEENMKIPPPP